MLLPQKLLSQQASVVQGSQHLALNLSKFTLLRIFARDNQDVKIPGKLGVSKAEYFFEPAAQLVSYYCPWLDFFGYGECDSAMRGLCLIEDY
jgi:hypothetical protein